MKFSKSHFPLPSRFLRTPLDETLSPLIRQTAIGGSSDVTFYGLQGEQFFRDLMSKITNKRRTGHETTAAQERTWCQTMNCFAVLKVMFSVMKCF